jgi:hypothetical protein
LLDVLPKNETSVTEHKEDQVQEALYIASIIISFFPQQKVKFSHSRPKQATGDPEG